MLKCHVLTPFYYLFYFYDSAKGDLFPIFSVPFLNLFSTDTMHITGSSRGKPYFVSNNAS